MLHVYSVINKKIAMSKESRLWEACAYRTFSTYHVVKEEVDSQMWGAMKSLTMENQCTTNKTIQARLDVVCHIILARKNIFAYKCLYYTL